MTIKPISILAAIVLSSSTGSILAQATGKGAVQAVEPFSGRVLVSGLEFPWEITWGPDNHLWVTERTGRRVTRIDPKTGAKRVAITIDEVLIGPQHEGLLGLTLHPDLLKGRGSDYVYVVYTYDASAAKGESREPERRAKLVRLTYNAKTQTLGQPVTLIDGVPAGADHNAGRIKFGLDGMLYYPLGEQGGNQFASFCNPIHAQDLPTAEDVAAKKWSSYTGKILRLAVDGSVPPDNPSINGVRSHIYSYGHRNPQGLVIGSEGTIYSAEHGPNTDDELNIIEAGKNYGWPHIAGYRDNQAYEYSDWSAAPNCAGLKWNNSRAPPEVPTQKETDWQHPDFKEPIFTMYTVPSSYSFGDATCGDLSFICRPSIGPSSVDFYPRTGRIPGWAGSLLVTTLKNGGLYRFKLTADGKSVRDVDRMFTSVNRYRDLTLAPDGMTIYVATDNGGYVRDAAGGATDKLANPGSILEFKYSAGNRGQSRGR